MCSLRSSPFEQVSICSGFVRTRFSRSCASLVVCHQNFPKNKERILTCTEDSRLNSVSIKFGTQLSSNRTLTENLNMYRYFEVDLIKFICIKTGHGTSPLKGMIHGVTKTMFSWSTICSHKKETYKKKDKQNIIRIFVEICLNVSLFRQDISILAMWNQFIVFSFRNYYYYSESNPKRIRHHGWWLTYW